MAWFEVGGVLSSVTFVTAGVVAATVDVVVVVVGSSCCPAPGSSVVSLVLVSGFGFSEFGILWNFLYSGREKGKREKVKKNQN